MPRPQPWLLGPRNSHSMVPVTRGGDVTAMHARDGGERRGASCQLGGGAADAELDPFVVCMLSLHTAACMPPWGCRGGRHRCLAHAVDVPLSPPTLAADVSPHLGAPHDTAPTGERSFIVPKTPPEPALFASVGASVNVVPFSAAPGGGLPLWAPSGLALTLLAVLAARESRPRRGLAVEALAAFTVQPESSPSTSPLLDAEAFAALQRADEERRAREAAEEAVREAERRRFVEAEQLRIEARNTTSVVDGRTDA